MAVTRRDFVKTAGAAAAASLILPTSSFATLRPAAKRRYAIVGTGERAVGMWARPLVQNYTDVLDVVGMCDINAKRVGVARKLSGANCPTFTDFDQMCDQAKPDLLMVTTVDGFHSEYIARGLDRGIDVITEKPMVIDEKQCRVVLDAEKRNKRNIIVTFNYRYAPKHQKI